MYTVQFCFDVVSPDTEDQEVRDYLMAHELEPRYRWDEDSDGRKLDWMQFGGCYLGNHLRQVGLIQRRAVEVELLTEAIENYVGEDLDSLGDSRSLVVESLIAEFSFDSSFSPDEDGQLGVTLDRIEVLEALQRLMAS